jgi:predicted phosphodiesterase
MRFLIYSDLHLETGDFSDIPPENIYDAVILAGDIHDKGSKSDKYPHLEWIKRHFTSKGKPVYYIFGNHEYYGGSIPVVLNKVKELASKDGLIHVLEKETHLINTGVEGEEIVIAGTTLWTDFNLFGNSVMAKFLALGGMMDYQYIRRGKAYGKLLPEHISEEHGRSRFFLGEVLHNAKPKQKVIIVTHHAPSSKSVPEFFKSDPLTPCYASNLDHFFESQNLKLWVHGHTHNSFDYYQGEARIVCNPRGYYGGGENRQFTRSKIIEI